MKVSNLKIEENVIIDDTSSINNVHIAADVKIAKFCSIYGAEKNILEIGAGTYIGMFTVINGFSAKIRIGCNVSIASGVNIMADSGPNASEILQRVYPLMKDSVTIGDHCWIGANAVIMPGVQLGDYCVVAANSFVNQSFPSGSVIGGTPAKLIKVNRFDV
ncbi:galactoside O-acetyltransferase [Arcticibacter pallidicorallinus]|uniref:Galactoside O-acetyltransferase n=1 Tax=Arcticibacter pallidicorallinus TaxID=1259464 RepID=A0A2T0U713_9SPHI|nr:acyltransferase [Arcticibacter pallidicorallinus]PRY53672.1 galactoside O-acetyltransferase [Arcticibacter pallidicorallinus]